MMPECEIYKIDLVEGACLAAQTLLGHANLRDMLTAMDGNQTLTFYWVDPIEAAKRYLANGQYSGKLYTKFEPATKRVRHVGDLGVRCFDSRANSGVIFEAAQLIDVGSSPVLILFFADCSFSGQHMGHHPIYSKH